MFTSNLIAVADAYCAATGLSRGRVSTLVFQGGRKLDLIAGGTDINTRTFEKAMLWFAANWPEGVDWPEGIERPEPVEPAETAAAEARVA